MEKTSYGYIKEGKVFRKGFLEYPDLAIGDVKGTEEESITFYENRFDLAEKQVNTVSEKIESNTNKGSFLMKVLHLKETLHQFDAIGDFEKLYSQLGSLETELNAYVEANRHKNLQIKTALLEELKTVAKSSEWKTASLAVKEIQSKWTKTGAVAEEQKEAIEGAYNELIKFFYDSRAAFYADLDKMMAEKEEDYKAFIKKAEALKEIDAISELKAAIRTHTEEWKALPRIKPAKHNVYWQEFQVVIKAALNKARKIEKTKKKASTKDNLKAKQEIIEQLTVANQEIAPNFQLSQVQKAWKAIGPVDKKVSNELYEKFLFLTDSISEKQFLNSLVKKKSKKDSSEDELKKLRIRLLRGLMDRDISELRTFEENLGKFSMAKGLDGLLDKKLSQQKRKVEVKKGILQELKKQVIKS
ncbi:DUF349 domain-containing protein [Roseivirga misakiensis]|uniref:DUF349 domain-containing protein n=1 Tax=Roseivirga misakiensis TaxID=1563681 RepID=UPI00159F2A47|nr:DUF349 domain-containing protein [Roseivirga misakiensis]